MEKKGWTDVQTLHPKVERMQLKMGGEGREKGESRKRTWTTADER